MRELLTGAAIGAIVGIAEIELGLLGPIVAMTLLLTICLYLRRQLFLAGSLAAIGAIWLALTANSALKCAETADFCGQANYIPLAVIGVLLIFGSAMLGMSAIKRS